MVRQYHLNSIALEDDDRRAIGYKRAVWTSLNNSCEFASIKRARFTGFCFWLPGFRFLLGADQRCPSRSSNVSCHGRHIRRHRLVLFEPSRQDIVDEVDDWGDYLLIRKRGAGTGIGELPPICSECHFRKFS
jgi:hypothetical protein